MAQSRPLRGFFCPSHMIPILDITALFSHCSISAIITTTPPNEPFVRPAIDHSIHSTSTPQPIDLLHISFPSPALLPSGQENLSTLNPITPQSQAQLPTATFFLQEPLFTLLRQNTPDCLISDSIDHWTTYVAAQLGIPASSSTCCALRSQITKKIRVAEINPQKHKSQRTQDITRFSKMHASQERDDLHYFGESTNERLQKGFIDHTLAAKITSHKLISMLKKTLQSFLKRSFEGSEQSGDPGLSYGTDLPRLLLRLTCSVVKKLFARGD